MSSCFPSSQRVPFPLSFIVPLLLFCSACAPVYDPHLDETHEASDAKVLGKELKVTVETLANDIGERNCYQPENLEASAAWIEEAFQKMGYRTRRLPVYVPDGEPYHCGEMTVWNIEAEKTGITKPNEILIVGAHYDSKVGMRGWHDHDNPNKDKKGTPGANDNASGIAATLALARIFEQIPTERSIRFVAFVNEEPPFYQTDAMGSLVYARYLVKDKNLKVVGMLTPETLGCYSPERQEKRVPFSGTLGLSSKSDYVCFLSNRNSIPFTKECAEVFQKHSRIELRRMSFPRISKTVAWSDDWSFWEQGIPAFAVTDTTFLRSDHYHELSDTPEKLDYETMAEVVWGLRYVVEHVANKP